MLFYSKSKVLCAIVLIFSILFLVVACSDDGDGSDTNLVKAWFHPATLTDNISPDGRYARYPEVAMGGFNDR